jgi:hypothetical protein
MEMTASSAASNRSAAKSFELAAVNAATAYLLCSVILGTADWATVLNTIAKPVLWRRLAGVGGSVLYLASIGLEPCSIRSALGLSSLDPACAWQHSVALFLT